MMWAKIKGIKFKQLLIKIVAIILIIVFSGLILAIYFDYFGPTSNNEIKYYEVSKRLDDNAGDFFIKGIYESKGIISANKDIKLHLYQINYYIHNKTQFDRTFPNNITAEICPYPAKKSDDLNAPACFDVVMNKTSESYYDVFYRNEAVVEKDIQFMSSGKLSLFVDLMPFTQINEKDVFDIAPSYVNAQLELNKYMFILTLIGIFIAAIQVINLFRKDS